MRNRALVVAAVGGLIGFLVWATVLMTQGETPIEWTNWRVWGLTGLVLVTIVLLGLTKVSNRPTDETEEEEEEEAIPARQRPDHDTIHLQTKQGH